MSLFNIAIKGKCIVTNYVAKYNHSQWGANEQRLSCPHWKALTDDLLADSLCVLIALDGGPLFVGFQLMNLDNRLGEDDKKSFDGSDTNSLIGILNKWPNSRILCFHVFEVDQNSFWLLFPWLDKQMLEECKLFDDLWHNIPNKQAWHDLCSVCWHEP